MEDGYSRDYTMTTGRDAKAGRGPGAATTAIPARQGWRRRLTEGKLSARKLCCGAVIQSQTAFDLAAKSMYNLRFSCFAGFLAQGKIVH
jgi:hypothetical protein